MKSKPLLPIFIFALVIFASKAEAALTVGSTSVTGSGAVTLQPASGSNLNVTLAGAGDLAVNTNQLYVDTSTGFVGVGTAAPGALLHVFSNVTTANSENYQLTIGTIYSGAISSYGAVYGLDIETSMSSNVTGTGYAEIYSIYSAPNFSGTTSGAGSGVELYGSKYRPSFTGTVGGASDSVYLFGVDAITSSDLGTVGDTQKTALKAAVFGTADTNYALYITSTGATTNYAIHAASGINYFGGNVGIGINANQTNSKLEVKDGHIASSQTTAPTPSVTGTGYSGASIAAGGTDTKGKLTATVGAAVGTLVVTFQTTYGTAPTCTVTPASATAQVDSGKMYITTATGALTLNFVATPTGGSETWHYICIQ